MAGPRKRKQEAEESRQDELQRRRFVVVHNIIGRQDLVSQQGILRLRENHSFPLAFLHHLEVYTVDIDQLTPLVI